MTTATIELNTQQVEYLLQVLNTVGAGGSIHDEVFDILDDAYGDLSIHGEN